MKTRIVSNRTRIVIAAASMLFTISVIGYGQGRLAEGAMKLYESLTNRGEETQPLHTFTNYVIENRSVNALTLPSTDEPVILKSITAKDLDIIFERELTTESWMTEPFSDLHEVIVMEQWMSEPFSDLHESNELEQWMTEQFNVEGEPSLLVEDWMKNSFYNDEMTNEEELQVEEWMTMPLNNKDNVSEEDLKVEEWMKSLFN